MNNTNTVACLFLSIAIAWGPSCSKDPEVGTMETGAYTETGTALKDAADFPIGAAISPTPFLNDAKYSSAVKADFDGVTFEYLMKHGAIVKDDGSLNFTNTDALVNAVGGQSIFGHTLGWHQNQNALYLRTYAGILTEAPAQLAKNPGFESDLAEWNPQNTGSPVGSSSFAITTAAGEFRSGAKALKVIVDKDYGTSQWRVQLGMAVGVPMVNGKTYAAKLFIKCASGTGSMRMSLSPDNSATPSSYQGDQTVETTWKELTFTFTKTATVDTKLVLDLGAKANTYFIDDVSLTEVIPAVTGPQIAAKLDTAMGKFITGIVGRYKDKVKAWDVVNELFADNGALRTNANTLPSQPPADMFVWSEYMGADFALKAFEHAKAADPTADLYINDYNLESSPAKLDSLIKFVATLKSKGAKVDGIGTQMHLGRTSTSYAGIDNMMKKLAATGLKIRISELDVKVVQGSSAARLTDVLAGYQAKLYEYTVRSYITHIPAAQRAGITIWGINDKNSWLYNNGLEFPLLYDNDYNKKPAYAAVLKALKGQ